MAATAIFTRSLSASKLARPARGARGFASASRLSSPLKTGYVWNSLYGWDDRGSGPLYPADPGAGMQPISHHVAHPDTKRRAHELVVVSGLIKHLQQVEPRHATEEEILSIHDKEYHDRIKRESADKGGDCGDGMSPFGKGGYEIGTLAAGGAIELVKAVVEGQVKNGYALVHPCGHHATADIGIGFCIFNNTAMAVKYAMEKLGVKKVAVLDWDVHHGNGTQSMYWDSKDVLTISIHQHLCFPANSGYITERGGKGAEGYSLNIPVPPGSGDGAYGYAIDSVVVPALEKFQPELIVVASGADPNVHDPFARNMVTAAGFASMTEKLMKVADKVCGGKLALIQEGGYSPFYVPICIHAMIQQLSGVQTLAEDPYLKGIYTMHGHNMEPHQKAAIDEVVPFIKDIQ
ncbi:hypothetical protein PLICRDRAFT_173305 [Plicaturopsis crispa FD-325 SS-3]|nr:hypothetical protein PLICRDRAFT_173305 [Plicaturopsis crispa FD-325 SS-3]